MLEAAGCDLLWLPSAAEMYPDGFATTISVAGVSERWDGAARPGHFDGVATVVAKLFTAVRPDVAIFGEKDFQQLAVIRRMVADLGLGVEIVGAPTVRDARRPRSVVAQRLSERRTSGARALALPRALEAARDAILGGEPVGDALDAARAQLAEAGFGPIDYVALVDAATLEPVDAAGGDDAADRGGADRRHAADRQSACRFGHSKIRVTARVNHLFALSAPKPCPRTKRTGDDIMAISQKSADFLLNSRLADAEAGDVEALFELGVTYSTGRGDIAVDLIEAHKWFNLAALSGDTRSQACRADISLK